MIIEFLRSVIAIFTAGAAVGAPESSKPSKPPAEVMRELRLQWLERKPTAHSQTDGTTISAVVMDWPLGEQTVTVLASAEGDASVYTTGSFGILGGIGHENARKAAHALIDCAKTHLALSSPTADFSYPRRGQIRFFFVTGSGVRTVSFTDLDVQKNGTDAYDLYAHAQAVLTEMRQIVQKQRGR